jgi:hypothetical protein
MSDEGFGGIEPPADLRAAAANIRVMYVALRKEGFTDRQALVIVGQMIASASSDD